MIPSQESLERLLSAVTAIIHAVDSPDLEVSVMVSDTKSRDARLVSTMPEHEMRVLLGSIVDHIDGKGCPGCSTLSLSTH